MDRTTDPNHGASACELARDAASADAASGTLRRDSILVQQSPVGYFCIGFGEAARTLRFVFDDGAAAQRAFGDPAHLAAALDLHDIVPTPVLGPAAMLAKGGDLYSVLRDDSARKFFLDDVPVLFIMPRGSAIYGFMATSLEFAAMSFDTDLGCFRHGKKCKFPREIVDHAIGAFAEDGDIAGDSWLLSDGGELDLYGDDHEVSGFSISNPPGDEAFWAGLLEILQKTTSVLYWPGTGAIVGHEATIAELPPDMVQVLGEFKVCSSVDEMLEFMRTH